jgi:hypothetical protein
MDAECPEVVEQAPGEMTWTRGFDTQVIRIVDEIAAKADACQQGYSWSTLSGEAYARAENSHGGIAETKKFTFKYTR